MKRYDPADDLRCEVKPSDLLKVAVTFPRAGGATGPVKFGARLSTQSAREFTPDAPNRDVAVAELQKAGFTESARGRLTVSMRCTRAQFEKLFGTRLQVFESPAAAVRDCRRFYFPGPGAPWDPEARIAQLIDDAYIQWPHIYMSAAKTRRRRPGARTLAGGVGGGPDLGYHYLAAPEGLRQLLNVREVHRAGITGKGVRVAMIDSGFDQRHAWFAPYRSQSAVVLAAGASSRATDLNGHGTGESANIFSVAPGVTFIGVKIDNDSNPARGATILEGFQEALRHRPQLISISMGYDLRAPGNQPMSALPNSLVPLEAEIQAAIAAGVVVIFSAGNGHYSFPGQMPNVISAGGVHVDAAGAMQASDYASAFQSAIYRGRSVPDFCGLVGLMPHAAYIRLPIPKGSAVDRDMAQADRTADDDGWGVFSGTSAAAPQIAGLCALLLQQNPGLSPQEIKAVLRRSSRDVAAGHASAASDPGQQGGIAASTGADGATGAGLVDARAALRQV